MTDGMETLSYSSAKQALSALADLGLRPQILLIDEAADGPLAIEIAERFEEEFNDWIPTIIVTDQPRGPAGDRTRERWIRVLRRPFDPGELTALVASGTQA
jgi:DNA-binding NtrC family response regulator